MVLHFLDPKALEVGAQPRQGTLMKKAGQVVGPVGQQLATTEPNKEIKVFPADALNICPSSSFSKRGMG